MSGNEPRDLMQELRASIDAARGTRTMTASDADRAKAAELATMVPAFGFVAAGDAIAAALAEARATERAAADQLRADVLALIASPATDEAVHSIAEQYRDPTLAEFAMNDLRDLLAARLRALLDAR